MDKDRFDDKIVIIGQKTFELGMIMSGFVLELLERFPGMKAEVNIEIPFYSNNEGYKGAEAEYVFFDIESELINVIVRGYSSPLIWDDLDLSAREILLNEIHHAYKSAVLYKKLSSIDGDPH